MSLQLNPHIAQTFLLFPFSILTSDRESATATQTWSDVGNKAFSILTSDRESATKFGEQLISYQSATFSILTSDRESATVYFGWVFRVARHFQYPNLGS